MTGFDYVVIGIVALSLLFGLWRGVVGEIIALLAWVLAIFVRSNLARRSGLPCSPACLTRPCGRWPVV